MNAQHPPGNNRRVVKLQLNREPITAGRRNLAHHRAMPSQFTFAANPLARGQVAKLVLPHICELDRYRAYDPDSSCETRCGSYFAISSSAYIDRDSTQVGAIVSAGTSNASDDGP